MLFSSEKQRNKNKKNPLEQHVVDDDANYIPLDSTISLSLCDLT